MVKGETQSRLPPSIVFFYVMIESKTLPMADYLRPCEAKSTALRKSITAYRRAVHPPVARMKREALEEYTKEFPVRDYVPEQELEARPFLSVAQVRRAVSRYRRAEHPPVSRMSREAASAYMDRFKVPVQDDGDQEAVALRRDKCGPPRVKRKRTGGPSSYQQFVAEKLRDKALFARNPGISQQDKMRHIAKLWRQQKRRQAPADVSEKRKEAQQAVRKAGKVPKKKKDASPFEGASDIRWWE